MLSTQWLSRAITVPMIAFVVVTWFSAQALYLRALSPGRMTPMLRELAKIDGTSVANTYATPIAIQTGVWSYFDPVFFVDGSVLDHDRIEVSRRDYRYLWFADNRSNADYLTPKYFVCWIQLNVVDVVDPSRSFTCGNMKGISEIRAHTSPFRHVEVAKDTKRDLWSIVKLDWSGPR
jgi:hypothetical protein